MVPLLNFIRDWWGVYAIDRAGVESGAYRTYDVWLMYKRGELGPNEWLRHVRTRKYALVGEVLHANGFATDAEFELWFPEPRWLRRGTSAPTGS